MLTMKKGVIDQYLPTVLKWPASPFMITIKNNFTMVLNFCFESSNSKNISLMLV